MDGQQTCDAASHQDLAAPDSDEKLLMRWLNVAVELPGKSAIRCAILIRSLASRTGNHSNMILTPHYLAEAGLRATSVHNGLVALECAGLIKTDRRPGRSRRVTIIEPDCDANGLSRFDEQRASERIPG